MMEAFGSLKKKFARDPEAKVTGHGNKQYISFESAVEILSTEPLLKDRAEHFAKLFDHNDNGLVSKEEVNEFMKKFEFADETIIEFFKEYERDGCVTLEEASTFLKKQEQPVNPSSRVDQLLKTFDKGGKVRVEEFHNFYTEAVAINEVIMKRFEELDEDRNGALSPQEVIKVIMDVLKVDEIRAADLSRMVDRNGDGNLDKTTFMQLWANIFGSERRRHRPPRPAPDVAADRPNAVDGSAD